MRIKRESPCLALRFMPIKLPSEYIYLLYFRDVMISSIYHCICNQTLDNWTKYLYPHRIHKVFRRLLNLFINFSKFLFLHKNNFSLKKFENTKKKNFLVFLVCVSSVWVIHIAVMNVYTQTHCIVNVIALPLFPIREKETERSYYLFSGVQSYMLVYMRERNGMKYYKSSRAREKT